MADIRPTPEQRPVVGGLARLLQRADEFARKPFGFENPPVAMISNLLSVPQLYRTMENYAYGSPLASGTSSVSRYLPKLTEDTKGAIEGATNLLPLVGPATRATTAGATTLGRLGERAATRAVPQIMERRGIGADLLSALSQGTTSNVVKPTGNLNFQPILRQEILKGSDVQPVENFLAQAKATPGVTKDAFIELADRYSDLAPGSKISKVEFEAKIPPSQYNKVDLKNAASDTEEELMEQAYDMVNEDAYQVFESVLDRLGVTARQIPEGQHGDFVDALQSYHLGDIGFDQLPSPLKRAMKREGLADDQYAFGDLVQEQMDEVVYQTAQDLRGYMVDEIVDGYRFADTQRLLSPNARGRLDEENYFEIGVTHPDKAGVSYHHYPKYGNAEEGLIGHFRGTMIPADVTDATAIVPGGKIKVGGPRHGERPVINLKPNSVIIEEIQSDAQKGAFSAEQTGALRQVHGTLFKAAIAEALERGARTVYFPTAQTIATIRSGDAKKYASIYDQQIIREGLNPLSKIPGVEINPVKVLSSVSKGKKLPEASVAYHEINFTDKAAKDILKGRGQQAPGYADGGKKKPSPFDELEPTFGDRMGAAVSDKATEGLLWLYDKLYDRDQLSSAHNIYLDTFVRDKRSPITAQDFNPQDLAELQNLILQKEKLTGKKGTGYISYDDYKTLPGGNQKRSTMGNLYSGHLAPRSALTNSLGQFNYERNPKTGQYRIIDEYDFNPQKTIRMGEKYDVPPEFYGDYIPTDFSLMKLARLYGGRKMPPGTGRKVDLSVPGKAEGGAVDYDPDEIARIAERIAPGYAARGDVDAEVADQPPFDVYKFADRRSVGGDDMSLLGFGAGANVGDGRLDTVLELMQMQRAQETAPQETKSNTARASYSKQLGDLGLNVAALKSLDAKDVYFGMLTGSIPVGLGRLLLGIQAEKTPWHTGVAGHSIGYSGRVGRGTLGANVQRGRSGDVSGNVEYRVPFAAGGSVDYDPTEIDAIVSQLKEEFHG